LRRVRRKKGRSRWRVRRRRRVKELTKKMDQAEPRKLLLV
jgi:hypothetical protein